LKAPWKSVETHAIDLNSGEPYNWVQKHIPDIDEDIEWPTVDITNVGKALRHFFFRIHGNPRRSTVVVKYSLNKDHDNLKAARWTDMFMNSWLEVAARGRVDPAKLKYIIRENIYTDDPADEAHTTRRTIEAAYRKVGGDSLVPREFRPDAADPAERAAFEALAGTAHVHRPILMLSDFTKTMKGVRIEWIKPVVYLPVSESYPDEVYNLVIKLTQSPH